MDMDPRSAQDQLAAAQRARSAAETPQVPSWMPPVIGAAVTVGFLVVALLPLTIGWRVVALLVALGLWASVGWLVLHLRSRQGLRGLRGWGSHVAVTLMICAISLIPGVLTANASMRLPYVIIGLLGGVAMWWATRRQVAGA